MIKALIFDNNGVLTLSDAEASISNFAKYFEVEDHVLRDVFDEISKPLDEGHITTDEFYQRVAKVAGKEYNRDHLRKVHIESYQPKTGMQDLVQKLKEDFDVAILTNFGDTFDEANEKVWGHGKVFDEDKVFVSSKLHMKKPDPEIYRYALDKLDCKPEEAVFVDDRESNLVTARNLGMKTVLFRDIDQLKDELQNLGVKSD